MSRAQSPFHEQMLILNILAEQLLKVTDAVQALRDQMNNLQINPSGERFPEAMSAFIGYIQVAVKRLTVNQHELLLCGIIAQKFIGRAKDTVRIDENTPNFPRFFEKLRYLFGKAQNLTALELQRDICIQ